jgi:hypothetical protein
MPRIQKKDLEESGIHQNKAEHERIPGEGAQRGRLPCPPNQSGVASWIEALLPLRSKDLRPLSRIDPRVTVCPTCLYKKV